MSSVLTRLQHNVHVMAALVCQSLEAITEHRVKTATVDVLIFPTMTTAPAYVSVHAVPFCTHKVLLFKQEETNFKCYSFLILQLMFPVV